MAATTLESLPFELLELILEHAVSDVDLESSPSAIKERNRFLKDVALLSRLWRWPAQAVLWSSLRVHSPAVAKRLLASPALGQFGSRELDLFGVHAGVEGLSGTTAARVVGKIRGVKWLRLADFGRLSARVLQHENLAGLKHLVLMTTFPDKPATISTLAFPFHLHSLSLFNRSYSAAFLHRLFTASAHSLRSLTILTSASSPAYCGLADAFPIVAPNLRHLSLQHRPSPALTEHFHLLASLVHLDCHFAVDLPAVLDSLPASSSKLSVLSIELDYNLHDVSIILSARLHDEKSALSGLKRLRIPRAPSLGDFKEFGGQPLLEACEENEVTVEIGEVVAWRTRSVFD
ncbi:hypothetical protein JCM6882_008704 [Rhodosporidiobolus microsporus]